MNKPDGIPPLGWAIHPDRTGQGKIAGKQHYDTQVQNGLDRFRRKHKTLPKIAIMHPDTIKLAEVQNTLGDVKIISRDGVRKGDIFFCMNEEDFVRRP